MGMYWLQHVFDRYMKLITGFYKCFFIVDDYNSHVNMRFINYCDQNRIFFVILPLYLMYYLQFLDIGFFGFLAEYYN
jgi:hypothetical protein